MSVGAIRVSLVVVWDTVIIEQRMCCLLGYKVTIHTINRL